MSGSRTSGRSSIWLDSSKATCTNGAATSTAAVAAYDRAIELVAMPQSARIAKAHALHLDGRRSDAAATATEAVTERGNQSDPWWPYIHGQAWRFEAYLKIARAMVLK